MTSRIRKKRTGGYLQLHKIVSTLSLEIFKEIGWQKEVSPDEMQEMSDIYSQLKSGLSEERMPDPFLLLAHERPTYGGRFSELGFLKEFEEQQNFIKLNINNQHKTFILIKDNDKLIRAHTQDIANRIEVGNLEAVTIATTMALAQKSGLFGKREASTQYALNILTKN